MVKGEEGDGRRVTDVKGVPPGVKEIWTYSILQDSGLRAARRNCCRDLGVCFPQLQSLP